MSLSASCGDITTAPAAQLVPRELPDQAASQLLLLCWCWEPCK